MKSLNVEAEGSELILKNKAGDHVIIPKKYRREVQDMIKEKCHGCIDSLVETLPVMKDYAADGSLVPGNYVAERETTAVAKPHIEESSIIDRNNRENSVSLSDENYVPPKLVDDSIADFKLPFEKTALDTETTKLGTDTTMIEQKTKDLRKKVIEDDKYRKNAGEHKEKTAPKRNSLEGLSKDEIKKIQKDLVHKGYLGELKANPKNKQEVAEVQSLLVSKGYDLGNYGPKGDGVDGMLGKKTKAALSEFNAAEIDGVAGPKTRDAFQALNAANTDYSNVKKLNLKGTEAKDIQGELQSKNLFSLKIGDFDFDTSNILLKTIDDRFKTSDDTKCTTPHCTEYIGDVIENKIKATGRERIGAFGDAWTIQTNLVGSGAKEVYNVFPEKKPQVDNPEEYIKSLTENKPNISADDIKGGDVINMYYGGSTNHKKAYEKGNSVFSTHLGIVKEDEKGNMFVEHNVGGKIYKEPIDSLLQNKATNSAGKPLRITAITRPEYNLKETADVYESTQANINFDNVSNTKTAFGKKAAAEFTQTLINNKERLLKDIPVNNNEIDNLIKASKVLAWKESGVKANPKSKTVDFGSNIRESIGGREGSKGFTQMKDKENLNDTLRENLKIDNKALTDPKHSAIATMYALSTKYIQIKNGLETKFSEDELAKLAVISWNEPVDMVIKTANKYGSIEAVIKAYEDSYAEDNKEFPYKMAVSAYDKYIK